MCEMSPCSGTLLEVLTLLYRHTKIKIIKACFCLENGEASVNTACYLLLHFIAVYRCRLQGAEYQQWALHDLHFMVAYDATMTCISHISNSLHMPLPQTKQLLHFWYPGMRSDPAQMKMICKLDCV